jgi:hypothetical protein
MAFIPLFGGVSPGHSGSVYHNNPASNRITRS